MKEQDLEKSVALMQAMKLENLYFGIFNMNTVHNNDLPEAG